MTYTQDIDILEFQQNLVTWYEEHCRDLPWRGMNNPYRTWVSEIMLQQTKVDTVIPYYMNFISEFPTIESLATADEEKVLKAWEGLGYYSRIRNLHSAAKEVVASYGGIIPKTREEIGQLKGVGPYTAGAILSIAYNIPEHAVDGNVMRVLSRIFYIKEDIAKPSSRKIFEKIVMDVISKEKPSEFNQGLMELGALVCTPTSPGCLLCPVRVHCKAYEKGAERELPIKSKKKKPVLKQMAAVVVFDKEGRLLIDRRPDDGLLARLWEVPNVEVKAEDNEQEILQKYVKEKYGIIIQVEESIQTVEHVFSHLKWHITVYKSQLVTKGYELEDVRWVTKNQMEAFTFPVSHQKIVGRLFSDES